MRLSGVAGSVGDGTEGSEGLYIYTAELRSGGISCDSRCVGADGVRGGKISRLSVIEETERENRGD
jgi:hypothetical protein